MWKYHIRLPVLYQCSTVGFTSIVLLRILFMQNKNYITHMIPSVYDRYPPKLYLQTQPSSSARNAPCIVQGSDVKFWMRLQILWQVYMVYHSRASHFHSCLIRRGPYITRSTLPNTLTTWWRHQMETFSALLAICAGNSPVPVNSPHKGPWRRVLMFCLICVWINGCVNNHESGDLRLYGVNYDVIVMRSTPQKSRLFLIDVLQL